MGNLTPVHRFTIRELLPGGRSSAAIVRGAQRLGLEKVKAAKRAEIYFVRGNIAPGELDLLGRFLFSDPVTQRLEIQSDPGGDAPGAQSERQEGSVGVVEVTWHAGVTDPVAEEILRAARELGIGGIEAASSGTRWEFSCAPGESLDEAELGLLASRLLLNPVVQRHAIGRVHPSFPDGTNRVSQVESFDIASMDDTQLAGLNASRRSALDPEEMKAIAEYFSREGRSCTDIEFETIAQTWSEHCHHKTFRALIEVENSRSGGLPEKVDNILATYLKATTDEIAAPWVRSAFRDNAGIIELDDKFDVSFKVETHNHPSAIEPFGGANTGVGGVIRDILGVSARPIAVTDVLCFGEVPAPTLEATMAVEHIRDGVVAGVQDYGNKMGIPTVNGGIHYHPAYASNPLVYCGCAGIAPRGSHPGGQAAGDRIVVAGGLTGRDGIRGATFSSMTMDASTFETAGSSVQIGAPIMERKVLQVVVEARDRGLYSAITDCGAGGLSSAVGEMASALGGDVELEGVGLKYPGLAPWEIWLSEAQERMVFAVPAEKLGDFVALCDANDVPCSDLGYFTGKGRLVVRYAGVPVLDLDCGFLHEGMPQRRLKASPPAGRGADAKSPPSPDGARAPVHAPSIESILLAALAHPAVASKAWAIRRYDHEVQGATRIGPFGGVSQKGPSDAAVLKPIETASAAAIAISNGFNPRYGEADSYLAAVGALDEAVRNAVAVGADPDRIAVVDNFCWGDPRDPENLWTLLRAAKGCRDAALAHRTPFVSGKDSFNNEFIGADGIRRAIPPSLLISAIGVVPDVEKVVTSAFVAPGNPIYLAGEFAPVLGASVVADFPADSAAVRESGPPRPSAVAPQVYRKIHKAVLAGFVRSAHDVSDGGILVALAEMCIGGNGGAAVDFDAISRQGAEKIGLDRTRLLFGETNGCIVLEIDRGREGQFIGAMRGIPCGRIGETASDGNLTVLSDAGEILRAEIGTLRRAFESETRKISGISENEGENQ